jgi:hypothetical protein
MQGQKVSRYLGTTEAQILFELPSQTILPEKSLICQ